MTAVLQVSLCLKITVQILRAPRLLKRARRQPLGNGVHPQDRLRLSLKVLKWNREFNKRIKFQLIRF
jgi:hypothetical protein